MKKVVFLGRDSLETRHLMNRLYKKGLLQGVVLESGGAAKRRKLTRMFRSAPFYLWPKVVLDLAALMIYSGILGRKVRAQLVATHGTPTLPPLPMLSVDDVNDPDCVDWLKAQRPEIMVVYGTAILKPQTLQCAKEIVLNIHTGIVPEYRNVHSDFWAYINGDWQHVGVSILKTSIGVDSGDIAVQATLALAGPTPLFEIKNRLLELAGDLIVETVDQVQKAPLVCRPQDPARARSYPTPDFKHIWRYFAGAR